MAEAITGFKRAASSHGWRVSICALESIDIADNSMPDTGRD